MDAVLDSPCDFGSMDTYSPALKCSSALTRLAKLVSPFEGLLQRKKKREPTHSGQSSSQSLGPPVVPHQPSRPPRHDQYEISGLILRLLLLLVLGSLASCTVNLSRRQPYMQAVGKHFILQHDFYIYYFNDYGKYAYLSFPCKLCLGTTHTLAGDFGYGLSKIVDQKYVGSKNFWVTLEGFLPKGSVVTITRVVEHKTLDGHYFFYIISPDQGPFRGHDINPSDIMHIFRNPPYTQYWSDPPIFEAQAALPLPSDGIWWK